MIKLKFNIQDSRKVRKFLAMYYEWGQDSKSLYIKITIEKYVQILLDKYEKFTGSDLKLQKLASAPVMTLIKSELEEPK